MEGGYAWCLNKWALDKNIDGELGLLLIISSFCANNGCCYASNEYLASLFKISPVSISRKIKKLYDLGYIKIEYEKRGAEVKKRIIRLTDLITDDYQNCYSTINKNDKEIITSNINKSINNKENIKENIPYDEIINYLNEKAGTKYRSQVDATRRLIRARYNDGFNLEDFKKVIDYKVSEWKEDFRMKMYLRPSTLFGTKFENYLLNHEETIDEIFDRLEREESEQDSN
jgi:uncharacterized phage protein (TIGR02220 family)